MSKNLYTNGPNGELELKSVPLDNLKPGYVRVQPKALAINPVDVKLLSYKVAVGSGAGCDFAGVVSELGPEVSDVKVGDTVAGGVPGNDTDNHDEGAFGDSFIINADSLYRFKDLSVKKSSKIPAGPVESFEQASSLGIGVGTPVVASELYDKVPFKRNSASGWALVYGAAGSLGFYTTQVYQYMGYDVIAVASAKHKATFESIGVKHLIDYHDDDWPAQARKIAGDDITLAYDTISFPETLREVYKAVSESKPARIHLSLAISEEDTPTGKSHLNIDAPLWFSFWNTEHSIGPWKTTAPPEFLASRAGIFKEINEFLPKLVSLPISVVGEGLESIPAAYEASEKASLEKIVVRID